MKSLTEINHEGQFHEYLTFIGVDLYDSHHMSLPWTIEHNGEVIARVSLDHEGEKRFFIKAQLLCKAN